MTKPIIIIVEDDRDLGSAIQDIIELDFNVRAELISDGLTAQQRLQSITPDLVILDMHLPNVSGIQLLHLYHSIWKTTNTKVVGMTADLPLIKEIDDLVDCCLAKPFSIENLCDTIHRYAF